MLPTACLVCARAAKMGSGHTSEMLSAPASCSLASLRSVQLTKYAAGKLIADRVADAVHVGSPLGPVHHYPLPAG